MTITGLLSLVAWCGCIFFKDTATAEIYAYCHTLSLHDALPIWAAPRPAAPRRRRSRPWAAPRHSARQAPPAGRSEEHTSELQSLMRISYAVFCLKKKKHLSHTLTNNRKKMKKPQNDNSTTPTDKDTIQKHRCRHTN